MALNIISLSREAQEVKLAERNRSKAISRKLCGTHVENGVKRLELQT